MKCKNKIKSTKRKADANTDKLHGIACKLCKNKKTKNNQQKGARCSASVISLELMNATEDYSVWHWKKPALIRVQKPTPALFVPRAIDPKTDGFPGLAVEHFCVKFGDHSSSGFLIFKYGA